MGSHGHARVAAVAFAVALFTTAAHAEDPSLRALKSMGIAEEALQQLLPPEKACTDGNQKAAARSAPHWLALRECQRSVAVNMDGRSIPYGWSGPGDEGILFINCDDNYDVGQDHYVYTPSGVYHFLIKTHRDYKGGLEPTQFRLKIEDKSYYFVTNIVGGLGVLYDSNGKALDPNQYDPADLNYSPAKKKPVLDFYHKVLTGSSAPGAAVIAQTPNAERMAKAEGCLKRQVIKLGSELSRSFKAQFSPWKTTESMRKEKLEFLEAALHHPACQADPEITREFEALLKDAREARE